MDPVRFYVWAIKWPEEVGVLWRIAPKSAVVKLLRAYSWRWIQHCPKDKEMFARLATTWITLANDLEAIEAQLKTKRQTPPEGIPLWRTGT